MPIALDEDERIQLTIAAKRGLRRTMRTLRESLPPARIAARSAVVVERLLEVEALRRAEKVALFYPILQKNELDLRRLHQCLAERGVRLYYPRLEPEAEPGAPRMSFREVKNLEELTEQGHGFAEPPATAGCSETLQVMVVPALALTPTGDRLGYGRGYYDEALARYCPPALGIGVGFDFQLLAELPKGPRDRPCQMVITDGALAGGQPL